MAANRNTSTELLIAGNDRSWKESFYQADGGIEIAQEILEQNLACISLPGGFEITTFAAPHDQAPNDRSGGSQIDDLAYITPDSLNLWKKILTPIGTIPIPGDDNTSRDIVVPWDYLEGEPHTNIRLAGDIKLTTGAAIQMAAGYEGKGKGISAGGTYLVYDIVSHHLGKNNSEARIGIKYRHIIGTESTDCYY